MTRRFPERRNPGRLPKQGRFWSFEEPLYRWVGDFYADAVPIRSCVGADGPVQDIYIAHAAEFDQDTGDPVSLDGGYVWTGGGILLKWADIESLEFRQTRELGTENADGEEAPLQA